jgi:predicted ATPase
LDSKDGDKEDLLKHLKDIGEPETTLISIQRDYAYTSDMVTVNCKERSISYVTFGYYNSAGTIIAYSHSKEEYIVPIEPGSFGERLAQFICAQPER